MKLNIVRATSFILFFPVMVLGFTFAWAVAAWEYGVAAADDFALWSRR